MSGGGHVDDQAALEQVGADRRRVDARRSRPTPTIRPRPRVSRTPSSCSSPSRSRVAQLAHAAQQGRVVDDVEDGERRGSRDRAAGEGRAVVAGLEHVGGGRGR